MNKKPLEEIQVVGLGQACVDHLGHLHAFPSEDAKVELADLHIQCGGPASTALVALSRLGVPVSFLGAVSDDPFGDRIIRNLRKENVDVSFLKVTPGHTSQYAFIGVTTGSGRRTIFWHRGTVPHLTPGDVDLDRFPNARILHLDSLMVAAATEAARQAKSRAMIVVMDGGTLREGMEELLHQVDILIASETFAAPLVDPRAGPEEHLHALRAMGPREVVITCGALGSMGLDRGQVVGQKAFEVPVKDTTGAGDVFHGGYIYGLLRQWGMKECMRFASAVAALKCAQMGAQAGIPSLKAVRHFLAASPS